jgi:hypothetical protein
LAQINKEETSLERKKAKIRHKTGYTCGFCGYKTKTRLELTTHKKERHGVI